MVSGLVLVTLVPVAMLGFLVTFASSLMDDLGSHGLRHIDGWSTGHVILGGGLQTSMAILLHSFGRFFSIVLHFSVPYA